MRLQVRMSRGSFVCTSVLTKVEEALFFFREPS